MLSRSTLLSTLLPAVLLAPSLAFGQIIYSDSAFNAGSYTTSSAGISDIRFGIDYSTIDIYGDGYLTTTIPSAPRAGGTTTGAFLSANNNSFVAGQLSFASISPTGVNVGTGTANPNYVMRVDVFQSTSLGVDNGSGTLSQRGSTNQTLLGINQANTTVQVGNLNAPGATGSLSGQGVGLSITADSGSSDDYIPLYGGALYRDRDLGSVAGQAYSQPSGAKTGLISQTLNDYWLNHGFEFDPITPNVNDNLNRFTGNHSFHSPDPTNLAGYLADGSGASRNLFLDAFPQHNDPLHYAGGNLTPPAFLAPNTAVPGGVPYNQWATHELYWVNGQFTYVIDNIPVLQFTPDADGLNGNDNVFSPYSSAGTGVLGFWDRFTSIALDPEGANFVIYDNLEFEVATANDVPSPMAYLAANGYLLPSGLAGDFDNDGVVDGNDFLKWQRGESPNGSPGVSVSAADLAVWQGAYPASLSAAASAVPEPTSILLLIGMAGCGLLGRQRR